MFFKKKEKNFLKNAHPGKVFASLGNTLKGFWPDFRDGEAKAVDLYKEYKRFKTILDAKYAINYNREKTHIPIGNKELLLTVDQCMYFFCISQNDSQKDQMYICQQNTEEEVYLINKETIDIINNSLLSIEKEYCKELLDFLHKRIDPEINTTSKNAYGINKIRKSFYPYFTKEYEKYHRFLLDIETYDPENKYNFINRAPIFHRITEEENPLITYELQSTINAYILDVICYITMLIPTISLLQLLNYVDNTGKKLKDILAETYGKAVVDYLYTFLFDMNCMPFRKMVSAGLHLV